MSAQRIKSWPTKERPRERLLAEGPERLTDADLLAIILRIGSGTFREGVPGTNAYEAALSILRDFRGLRGLDRARIHDLLKVPGLGPAKVAQIKAAFELGKRVCAGKLTAPAFESSLAVANHFRPRFTGKRDEIVIAVFLNGQNQRLGEKDITEGTPTQATVYIRRILCTGPDHERVVLDTKWKIPNDGKPGDADLQQMHAYNVQFGARRSFLLYPRVGNQMDIQGRFFQGEALRPSFDHNCGMVFLELFDGNKLRSDLGKELVAMLTSAD